LSADSFASESFSRRSLISSFRVSTVDLCLRRRESSSLSWRSCLVEPSSLSLSSSLPIWRRYCCSLRRTLSLSWLASSSLFLLSTANYCTPLSFCSYKAILYSCSSSSETRCSFSRERPSSSWVTCRSSSRDSAT
jgi:hypothetical protein